MIRVDVWLPDPASVLATGAFGAGALIRVERAATIGGAYAEITTIAVVATTVQYQYWYTSGVDTDYFRWRVSNAGNTVQSDYSDPFVGVNPAASIFPVSYATLDDLLALFETRPTQAARLARLGSLLGTATAQVNEACGGRDYFRHPTSGTSTWTSDSNGTDVLHVHEGLVSLETLEISQDGGLSYVELEASDYALRGADPNSAEPVPAGEPYFHVRLTGVGTWSRFPSGGIATVRLTGARGWATPPDVLVEATAQRARQIAFAGGEYSGSSAGPDEYGSPLTTDRFWPQSLYNFLARERSRFLACHL